LTTHEEVIYSYDRIDDEAIYSHVEVVQATSRDSEVIVGNSEDDGAKTLEVVAEAAKWPDEIGEYRTNEHRSDEAAVENEDRREMTSLVQTTPEPSVDSSGSQGGLLSDGKGQGIKDFVAPALDSDRTEPQGGVGSAARGSEMCAKILDPRGNRSRLKQPRLCLWLDLWRRTKASKTLGNLRKAVGEPHLYRTQKLKT
jgi:hypothetical protein